MVREGLVAIRFLTEAARIPIRRDLKSVRFSGPWTNATHLADRVRCPDASLYGSFCVLPPQLSNSSKGGAKLACSSDRLSSMCGHSGTRKHFFPDERFNKSGVRILQHAESERPRPTGSGNVLITNYRCRVSGNVFSIDFRHRSLYGFGLAAARMIHSHVAFQQTGYYCHRVKRGRKAILLYSLYRSGSDGAPSTDRSIRTGVDRGETMWKRPLRAALNAVRPSAERPEEDVTNVLTKSDTKRGQAWIVRSR